MGQRPALRVRAGSPRAAHDPDRGQPALQRQGHVSDLTPNDTLIGSFQYDNYNVTGRPGFPGARLSPPTSRPPARTRPRRSGTPSTAGCSGPAPSSRRSSRATGATTTSTRSTRRPSVTTATPASTRAAPATTTTPIAAATRSTCRCRSTPRRSGGTTSSSAWRSSGASRNSRSEYMDNVYYYDLSGAPYLAYSGYNYNIDGRNKRESYYAQDAVANRPPHRQPRHPPRPHPRRTARTTTRPSTSRTWRGARAWASPTT